MKIKIAVAVILLAIITVGSVMVKRERAQIPWTSSDGIAKLVTCDPAPKPNSKLWKLRNTWRPATQAELGLYAKELPPQMGVILAGGGIYSQHSIAESGCFLPGIKGDGSFIRRDYPPHPDDWQLLIKRTSPISGETTNKIGIFPVWDIRPAKE